MKKTYGRPVDWWCLGCVTYEMMCGLVRDLTNAIGLLDVVWHDLVLTGSSPLSFMYKPPFYSRDMGEMYERILREPLRFPDVVPMVARQWLEVQGMGGGRGLSLF